MRRFGWVMVGIVIWAWPALAGDRVPPPPSGYPCATIWEVRRSPEMLEHAEWVLDQVDLPSAYREGCLELLRGDPLSSSVASPMLQIQDAISRRDLGRTLGLLRTVKLPSYHSRISICGGIMEWYLESGESKLKAPAESCATTVFDYVSHIGWDRRHIDAIVMASYFWSQRELQTISIDMLACVAENKNRKTVKSTAIFNESDILSGNLREIEYEYSQCGYMIQEDGEKVSLRPIDPPPPEWYAGAALRACRLGDRVLAEGYSRKAPERLMSVVLHVIGRGCK